MTLLSVILILAGMFFLTVSSVGIIRLPDFYSRTHAVGKAETLGSMLVLGGLAAYNEFEITSLKLLVMLIFIAIANPTATHAIAREAIRSGLQPWIISMKEKEPIKKSARDEETGHDDKE